LTHEPNPLLALSLKAYHVAVSVIRSCTSADSDEREIVSGRKRDNMWRLKSLNPSERRIPRPFKVDRQELPNASWTGRHDSDMGAKSQCFIDAMCHEYNGALAFSPNADEFSMHVHLSLLVEGAEWFVHQDDFRIHQERTSDTDALIHPTRQLAWKMHFKAFESDHFNETLGFLSALFLGHSDHFQVKCNVFPIPAAKA
jgi:hypothetical protein